MLSSGQNMIVRLLCGFGVLAVTAAAQGATLGITADGKYFTIDGKPTFLLGATYYGAQTITTPSFLTQDLDDMVARGFNWMRVWVHWSVSWGDYAENVSIMNEWGNSREPYMSRFLTLVQECNARGIIVDATMCRYNIAGIPATHAQHMACAQALANLLLPYRNVYIDIGNECTYTIPVSEVGALVNAIKAIDPGRLCTASVTVEDGNTLATYRTTGHLDFYTPHFCRCATSCWAENYNTIRDYINWMVARGYRIPVHLQEPLRRGYIHCQSFVPVASDFLSDCSYAKSAEGAGWCFHNGDNQYVSPNMRPRRSFHMGDSEGRLFDQIDAEEWQVVNKAYGHINGTALSTVEAPVIREVSPDPETITAGMPYLRPMVLSQGYPWPSWSIIQGPTGSQVNANGHVTWTPSSADIGQTHTFEVRATNGSGTDTETWQITVQTGPLATFEAEGTDMWHQAGSAITGGWRITTANPNKFSTYGPYTTILPAGPLTARFWLRVDNNTADNNTICRLDINDADGVVLAGPVAITRQQFSVAGAYQAFDVNFVNPGNNHRIEFRTYYIGNAQLDQDKVEIIFQGGNYPPTVSAGPDQQLSWPGTVNLDGTVVDDGLPNPPATVTVTWSKVSGPGTVTFGNPNTVDTTAIFSVSGIYVLRLTANDSMYTASDEITITATGTDDFVISSEEFVASGTLGDQAHAGQMVHAEFDASGRLHMVWVESSAIRYKQRLTDGTWTTTETVPDSAGLQVQYGPRLAVSAAGEVHVVWNTPQWTMLYYAMRTSSGWGPRQTLKYNADGQHCSMPVITVDSSNRVHVIFLRWTSLAQSYHHIIKTGGTWSTEQTLNSFVTECISLTHDDSGNVYLGCKGNSGGYVRTAYMIWNGSWGTPQRPADSLNYWVGDTDIQPGPGSTLGLDCAAYDHEGDYWFCVGVYAVTVGQSPVKMTRTARLTSTTRVEEPRPQIGFDSQGNQYHVWTDNDELRYAIRQADGAWYAKDLNFPVGGGKQYFPELAVWEDTAHVLWEDNRGGIYHATISPPGSGSALPGKANNPSPAHQATGVSTSATLSWTAGGGATAHEVYFGTSNPPTYRGQQSGTSYNPGLMDLRTVYYWRIDEVNANGTTTGDSWIFTTQSAPGDFDADGDVDLADFGYLQRCYSGSGVAPASGCSNADLDGDNDVDQADFTQFKNCLGGVDQPPGC